MKRLLAIALALVMLVGLASAGMAEGKTEVTIWYYWETLKHQETLNAVISDFNGSQENVVVKAQYVPFADFKKQLSIPVDGGMKSRAGLRPCNY